MSVLDKYQMALLFANKPKFDEGANLYQDAALLISIRNKLVHFRTKWRTHGQESVSERKFEKKLAERVAPNALLAATDRPWFPDKCLGAACANWACATSRQLADEWSGCLCLFRSYASDLKSYPEP